MTEKKPRMSLDELLDQIDETARDQDAGPDRFRAAKLLLSFQSASVGLPEPMTDPDMIEALKRVMRPAGKTNCKIAYRQAFFQAKDDIDDKPDVRDRHLSEDEKVIARSIVSVPILNREFPELWRSGIHQGQPRGRGKAVLRSWLYNTACDAICDRKSRTAAENAELIERGRQRQADAARIGRIHQQRGKARKEGTDAQTSTAAQ